MTNERAAEILDASLKVRCLDLDGDEIEATEMAIALLESTPDLRPMTLEEAQEQRAVGDEKTVWFETSSRAPISSGWRARKYILGSGADGTYNKLWRIWSDKPTDEESYSFPWSKE